LAQAHEGGDALSPPAIERIETAELVLEPQVRAHAGEMFDVLCDPAIYEHENEPPESLEWLRARFERLESRSSPDGTQQWLNWVIRLPGSELAGYVQASVYRDAHAAIAYVLGSSHWGKGIASRAVQAMIGELRSRYGVRRLTAVLKASNARSLRLLERLGFVPGSSQEFIESGAEADELLMVRDA
jgi:[ribosomal protein S5]-alanine N-acetyltransferase